MSNYRNKKGFSLVEMIIYLSLMTIITLVIVQSIVIILRSNKQSFNNNVIENSAVSVLERVKRETRRAKNIDLINSNLANGDLQLNVLLDNGSTSTVKIIQSDGKVNVYEGGVFSGPLTINGVNVTSLSFKQIQTEKSEAIRTTLVINSGDKTGTFYSTEILRGSY